MINSSLPVSFSILRKSALLYKFFSVCAFRFPVFQTRMYPCVALRLFLHMKNGVTAFVTPF